MLMFLNACSGQRYKISAGNMSPTLKIGDVCKSENFGDFSIQRFNIVAFKMPKKLRN